MRMLPRIPSRGTLTISERHYRGLIQYV
ncbi:protein of unknown function [Rhodovastum atsumiense]|nr:protein of unknown function [Rhodovastum atsumiense]